MQKNFDSLKVSLDFHKHFVWLLHNLVQVENLRNEVPDSPKFYIKNQHALLFIQQ